MKTFLLTLSLGLLWNGSSAIPTPQDRPDDRRPDSTLRLVHVIFRHGNRNPENGSVWDSNPYTDESYYPEGWGQLTNKGKMTEYNLGRLYRERFDSFLGDIWNINIQEFRSTNVNRTKMSGLLVNAGLWPPRKSNIWNEDLPWQPIPYNYEPSTDDPVLAASSSCSAFYTEFAEVYSSAEIQEYLAERYGDAMQVLYENADIAVTDYSSAAMAFDVMKVQEDLGFEFDDWVSEVYPEPLNSLSLDFYYLQTNTTKLRQIVVGSFVQKIITDTQNHIDGLTPNKKIYIYSAHDLNVGTIITALEAYKLSHTPPYGSNIIFEVHEIRRVWGLKIFYVDYTEGSPHPAVIPGCGEFCPLDRFVELVGDLLPTTDVCNGN